MNAFETMIATLVTLVDNDEPIATDPVARACRPISDEQEADHVLGLSERESYSSKEYWHPCDDEAALAREEFVSKHKAHRYCRTCKGKLGWWDCAAGIDAWGTTTGERPVIFDQAHVADEKRSAGGWSDVDAEWVPTHYSQAKPGYGKSTYRRFLAWYRWVTKADRSDESLRDGWKRFNVAYHKHANAVKDAAQKLDQLADREADLAHQALTHAYFNIANGKNIAVSEAEVKRVQREADAARKALETARVAQDTWLNYRQRTAIYAAFKARGIVARNAR
jgi:hypothetical protein